MKEEKKLNPITKLELLERSNELYTSIEYVIGAAEKEKNEFLIAYLFCRECSFRDLDNLQLDYKWDEQPFETETQELESSYIKKYGSEYLVKKMYELYDIDKEFFEYYYYVLNYTMKVHDEDNAELEIYNYHVENKISRQYLIEAIGKEKVEQLKIKDHLKCISLEDIIDQLSDEDKEKILTLIEIDNSKKEEGLELSGDYIKEQCRTFHTHIYRDRQSSISNHKLNSYFVELDISKPLDELIEFISKIKKDYSDDPASIKNIYNLLAADEPFILNELKELGFQSREKSKAQKLADLLFIYDCKKAGIHGEIISKEITAYYDPQTEKSAMVEKTIREFYKVTKDFIDNGKYKHFLSGFIEPDKENYIESDISSEPIALETEWYNNIDNKW